MRFLSAGRQLTAVSVRAVTSDGMPVIRPSMPTVSPGLECNNTRRPSPCVCEISTVPPVEQIHCIRTFASRGVASVPAQSWLAQNVRPASRDAAAPARRMRRTRLACRPALAAALGAAAPPRALQSRFRHGGNDDGAARACPCAPAAHRPTTPLQSEHHMNCRRRTNRRTLAENAGNGQRMAAGKRCRPHRCKHEPRILRRLGADGDRDAARRCRRGTVLQP